MQLRVVAREVFDVEGTLSNPFKFEIIVQRISLSTSGVAFEPFPASLNLPPETPAQTVLLSGKPLESGVLCIRGVHIRSAPFPAFRLSSCPATHNLACLLLSICSAFNLMTEHRVDDVGKGLPGLQVC